MSERVIREFNLGDERLKEETVVRGVSFTSRFDIDQITQIGWFRFMEEIVSYGYVFVLHVLLYQEAIKLFEGKSDV